MKVDKLIVHMYRIIRLQSRMHTRYIQILQHERASDAQAVSGDLGPQAADVAHLNKADNSWCSAVFCTVCVDVNRQACRVRSYELPANVQPQTVTYLAMIVFGYVSAH